MSALPPSGDITAALCTNSVPKPPIVQRLPFWQTCFPPYTLHPTLSPTCSRRVHDGLILYLHYIYILYDYYKITMLSLCYSVNLPFCSLVHRGAVAQRLRGSSHLSPLTFHLYNLRFLRIVRIVRILKFAQKSQKSHFAQLYQICRATICATK